MRGVSHDPVLRAKLMALHEQGVPLSVLSDRHGIARPVLSRWWARYRVHDLAGLQPKSRRPHHSPRRPPRSLERSWRRETSAGASADRRRTQGRPWDRATGPRGGGRHRLPRAPRRPVHRYEKTRPGELLHLDLKYLSALEQGPEFEYAAIDDFSREAVARLRGSGVRSPPHAFWSTS